MLELEQIIEIIEAGRPEWVNESITEHNRLNVHINGKGTAAYLQQIDKIENADQLSLRKKFLTTNRHAMANLSRPIDKVFSAKGGGNIYNLTQEKKEKTLRDHLSDVRHGKTIRNWIKDIQANKYYTDPAGLVFFEWKDGETHPTIKSIKSIFNYKSDGRVPEWVVFMPFERPVEEVVDTNFKVSGAFIPDKKDEKKIVNAEFYRVVDNKKDYLIKKVGDTYTIVEDETFDNPFGKVPAIINSDLVNSDLTYNESPFEVVISLADHYLRTGTIKNLTEFLQGFPIFWRYLTDCPACEGSGQVKAKTCGACGGLGVNLRKDVTEIINISIPTSTDDVKITPDVAGYVAPEITAWQEMRIEQEYITGLMELTMWGSKVAKDVSNETATAAFLNVQPVNDRLNGFADAFQDMEKKMTDLIGEFYLTKYVGSSISYGRRFLVEPPDVIWKKYEEAREKGNPKVTLDYLLIQFYQSEFANDLESLTIAQKGIRLEPFVHKSDEQVKDLALNAEDQKSKYYFNEWFKTVPQMDLLSKPIDKLQKEFETYLGNKQYGIQPEN